MLDISFMYGDEDGSPIIAMEMMVEDCVSIASLKCYG